MQAFLRAIGAAETDAGDVLCTGDSATLSSLDGDTVISPLGHYAVLAVEGPDGGKFLQGQLTCDVTAVTDSRAQPGACCSVKGRMLASFALARRDAEHHWLRLRRDIAAATVQHLGKYAVFFKAGLRVAEELIGIGLHGPGAAAALAACTSARPEGRYGVAATEGGLALQLDAAGQWFECWLPAAEAEALWRHCQGDLRPAGTPYWRWLCIRAGLAEISAATVDQFIPQMLNLHLTGAVSFNKGCYTGQEIVARAHYRGQVKRHLHRAAVAAAAPAPGTEVETAGGQKVGVVVESVAVEAGRAELLAVLNDGALTPEAPLSANGAALQLLELPYAIT